ncbi:4-hydroxythreonine-4-phosphate dehydrogenase [Chitiniphilus shinanonensis]|uniref:4-hydroxythreonine-4-phosphate dehydrogenase n=1 Tax=Chitiniphilus shinanonensis TaxID=553088 RepID=A0ABQ6BQ82_9NEIS|nr:4-hydroxythreonine-4-phosphate dehydrogenase PdxA [Chitiniphilus shinanonensis]GLS03604.1 4-hydroxythreonine-4-phosphate dehydrogenase [Chitiniphilus shinanonensis]
MRPALALTTGEPAGIGPEISAALAAAKHGARLVLLGDRSLLAERARAVGATADWPDFDPARDDDVAILHLPLAAPSLPGRLDPANAAYVLQLLDRAVDGCRDGTFAAIVTAPIHKGVINDAGVADGFFFGHTEYLAARTGTEQVVMLLTGGGLRVALATTHLPLAEVPAAITQASLSRTLRILHADLKTKFGLADPRILVAGLNPHAGENGHLGREEIEVIEPTLDALRAEGLTLIGPLPADTLFNRKQLEQGDAVLAMYHDQGLPVLKFASFGHGINVTLGLPLIRTSVDHGTALDLAGSGKADPGSLAAAVALAQELVQAAARPSH